ncbi:helix-turn-helix transcriptional regulator [Streptomyces sp. AV19]|uniref:helix-turn-helix domain-containing protein n=1 Tax=Streptomyces sp. AV19 TaxID=2793068 RepID=UPI0024138C0D|nr:helix-turn-helix transcriptional regulator [Streptomyces sp. AV19]MDG4534294.1 helix-turn-helix transcriptional regulator [Streptomyces sp. AV19]
MRKRRRRMGWTQRQLGEMVHLSHGRIAQIELGNEVPAEDVSKRLDAVLEAGGELHELWEHVERVPLKGWMQQYIDRETKAVAIHCYMGQFFPGLLQTAAYARELLRVSQPWCTPAGIEAQVERRLARQSLLTKPDPPLFWVVLDEVALRRPVGGPSTMREQLTRIVESTQAPNIEVQVLPFTVGCHASMGGALTLLSFEHGPDMTYLEGDLIETLVRDKESVLRHSRRYDHVHAVALPPDESIALLERTIKEFSECKP